MFWILSIVFSLISFYFSAKKSEVLLIPFLACAFFFFTGISSFSVEEVFCSDYSGSWSCYKYSHVWPNLGYLSMGLGILMLIYAIYISVSKVGEAAVTGV